MTRDDRRANMDKKLDKELKLLEGSNMERITNLINDYKQDVICHDPECIFNSSCYHGENGMCLMMKKSCLAVPPTLCTCIQIANCIGNKQGEDTEKLAQKLKELKSEGVL